MKNETEKNNGKRFLGKVGHERLGESRYHE